MKEHTFTGKHVGRYDELDDKRRQDEPGNGRRNAHDLVHRLGVRAFNLRDLLQQSLTGNPYRGGAHR